jgi:hypothetical protein
MGMTLARASRVPAKLIALVSVTLVSCGFTVSLDREIDAIAVAGDVFCGRVCVDSTHSGHCIGGTNVTDRSCPPGSTCMDGYCAPPLAATTCVDNTQCAATQVCDLYVVNSVLSGYCTDVFGPSAGSCPQAGDDPNCIGGICAARTDGSDRRCMRPCVTSAGCIGSSQKCSSVGFPMTIEGTTTAGQKYCVPD